MADAVTARNEGQKFTPHPEGPYAAVCVDVLNLGDRVETYQGKVKIAPKCALVFRTGELRDDGTPFEVAIEFTVSMYDRASLRKFLEAWRGKPYTEEQAESVPSTSSRASRRSSTSRTTRRGRAVSTPRS